MDHVEAYRQQRIQDAAFASSLEEALESGEGEQRVQSCLETYPRAFGFLAGRFSCFPKFKLADAYVPDFLLVGTRPWHQSHTPMVSMVEIERPDMPLFTNAGDPTALLTHAQRQVQDWQRWVQGNRGYLADVLRRRILADLENAPKDFRRGIADALAHGFEEQYVIIAGRRRSLNIERLLRLQHLTENLLKTRIITYDVFFDFLAPEDPWR